MSFRRKILLALALAGVLPVVLLGTLSHRASRERLQGAAESMQAERATELSRACSRVAFHGIDGLRLAAGYLPLEEVSVEELPAILQIPFRQLSAVDLLALLDGDGKAIAPAVYSRTAEGGKPAMSEAALREFSAHVPVRAAASAGSAIGVPYALAASGEGARVALAVRVGQGAPRLLVAELSLRELEERLQLLARDGDRAMLFDAAGLLVASAGGRALGEGERALLQEGLSRGWTAPRTVASGDGVDYIAAFASAPDLGWGVLVERRASAALAPAEAVRRYTLFWSLVALLVAGTVGVLLSRGVSLPVASLSRAVKALSAGNYHQEVLVDGKDEIAALGDGFNRMAQEILRRDSEIRALNSGLEKKVEEKTRELQVAQDQIQRARRLAALGSLSAGIAHELNNPLTGIIGLGTLLRQELKGSDEAQESLGLLLNEGRKMARIISDLRQLADREAEQAGVRFSVLVPVQAALDQMRDALAYRSVEVRSELPPQAPEVQGDPDGLRRVFAELLQNALTAMPRGGTITVGAEAVGGEAMRVWVKDTGRGIPDALRERIFDPFFTTKDEPGRVGLGLSICNQIVEAHHGRIVVESQANRGSTFTVILPAAGARAHLR